VYHLLYFTLYTLIMYMILYFSTLWYIDFATVDDVDEPAVEVGKEKVSKDTVQKVCMYLILNLFKHVLLCF